MMIAGTGSISRLLCQFSQFYCASSIPMNLMASDAGGGFGGQRTGLLSNTRPYVMILRAALRQQLFRHALIFFSPDLSC